MQRFEVHTHSHYSNLRLLDCINRPKDIVNRALKLGMSGFAITDHETLSGHIKFNQLAKEIRQSNPDFKIALGNEIYLCDTREKGQNYYHFILIAKNAEGHQALRELSSCAWMNSYQDYMERVVTTYDDLTRIVQKYPESLIATTACLGGFLSSQVLALTTAEQTFNAKGTKKAHDNIVDFVSYCKNLFGNDFYIECAPGCSKEQIIANKRLISIANAFSVKTVIGCDAHYLKKEDRYVHKAYLNSQDGKREVDSFYEFAYMQSEEEIKQNLRKSFSDDNQYEVMVRNSGEIYQKIEFYDLSHSQIIPKVKVKDYPIVTNISVFDVKEYPVLASLLSSQNEQERYWINECLKGLKEKGLDGSKVYLDRLEEEADTIRTISANLSDCVFAYFNTFKHYIDFFWDNGSIVGPGRGSSTCFLSNYLLGIVQLDAIQWDLPAFRFLNKSRTEMPDIDTDLAPSRRPAILQAIKNERAALIDSSLDTLSKKNLGLTLVATFLTEGTKSAILTSCRGYRSEEYPNGIDVDIAQYMSSLIPSERGFLWSLKDVTEGNLEKGRKPVVAFLKEVGQYPGLLDIMIQVEGLIKGRGSHASGVILYDNNPYDHSCFMKTPSGEIITQWDLHDVEYASGCKFDFLVTEVSDKIISTIKFLQKDNLIDAKLTLKEVYDEYLHPQVLNLKDSKIWDALGAGTVLDCFQFETEVGSIAAKKIQPKNPVEMSNANAVMRLMAQEKGAESPLDKYIRFKNNFPFLWEREMDKYGLTQEERESVRFIYEPAYGCPCLQEDVMLILMKCANFTLAEANQARKTIAKKLMNKIPELKAQIFNNIEHSGFAQYIWDTCVSPQLG